MLRQHPADEGREIRLEVTGALQLVGELLQLLGHDGIESDVGAGDGLGGAQGPELELIAGEGHGGSAVPVRVVLGDVGQHVHADAQRPLAGVGMGGAVDDGVHHRLEIVPQEDGEDGGRRFLSAQAQVVAGEGHRRPQEVLILVHALQKGRQEEEELGVLAGGLAGLEEVFAAVRCQGPVVVLAGAVDSCEGLFMQEADETVALRHLLHHLHGELVLVAGAVGVRIDGGHLVLTGGDLVVLGLGEDAQLPELRVQVLHVIRHPGADGAIVVVIQLLAPGSLGAEEGPAGEAQVLAFHVVLPVDEEVLLLGAHLGRDPAGLGVAEEPQDAHGLAAHLVHGAEEGGLLVQGLAGVGAEDRGDAEGGVLDEGEGRGVPGGVAPGLKGGPQPAGGEGGGVRLAPDQLLARELHHDLAPAVGGDEGVVLLGGDAGHGLEPVGEVGAALLRGPLLHGLGDLVGDGEIQGRALGDAALPGGVGRGGKALSHRVLVEDQAAEELGKFFRCAHGCFPPCRRFEMGTFRLFLCAGPGKFKKANLFPIMNVCSLPPAAPAVNSRLPKKSKKIPSNFTRHFLLPGLPAPAGMW